MEDVYQKQSRAGLEIIRIGYLSCKNRLSTKVAIEASDFGLGGYTLGGISQFAHGYLSEWESIQSSTFRGLLGVIRCLQSLIELCKNNLV